VLSKYRETVELITYIDLCERILVFLWTINDLKGFVNYVAPGIDGMKGDDDNDDTGDEDAHIPAGLETVRNYWNNFTGALEVELG